MKYPLLTAVALAACCAPFYGCRKEVKPVDLVAMQERNRQYLAMDEQNLQMMISVQETKRREFGGVKRIQPIARDKRINSIMNRLQSKTIATVREAEREFYRIADPNMFYPNNDKARADALHDLVSLLDHGYAQTRSAAVRIIARCYSTDADKKYVFHVIDRLTDPASEVRFFAWYSLSDRYGKQFDYRPGQLSKEEADVYIGNWRTWYQREIDPKYNGKLPDRKES